MNRETLQYFKRRLLEEKNGLSGLITHMKGEGLENSLGDSINELSVYDQHPADVGSEVFERSKDSALQESQKIRLRGVNHALERLENGMYGICEKCNKEISLERLEAIPYTTMCRACSENTGTNKAGDSIRPVEEDVMERPVESYTGFDGEDSWESVARGQENAPGSGAGAYYGPSNEDVDETGFVEKMDNIAYKKGKDGFFYEDNSGK
ncbi:MAG: TraR/DksA C4-type zinc finger protein [Clostridiales bacterium]|nr:TraR/DksA C4-type zinc finger protein [Clostridiales bacterium]MCF8022122.1 TraR/DksA C4-type zinc finger protein [Clostridiales bacterium]